jgi:hypothetical protein
MDFNITIPVSANNRFDADKKKEALQQLATLSVADVEKLSVLSKNEKALKAFRDPPILVKNFLGIK